ncbi:MAG TPA: hypothetical protein PKJ97_01375, partial [Candidatus Bilamarchaeaceae archaeon]|nr:hypothetical protein [Candidatus Bilamarchaeaceae archaeon]
MMLARAFLFLMLLASVSFPAYSGRMVAVVEKEWNIASNGTIQDVLLNSSFLARSGHQRIISMNATHGELVRDGDEIR